MPLELLPDWKPIGQIGSTHSRPLLIPKSWHSCFQTHERSHLSKPSLALCHWRTALQESELSLAAELTRKHKKVLMERREVAIRILLWKLPLSLQVYQEEVVTLYVYGVYAHILKEINIGFTQVEQEYILFSTKLCCREKKMENCIGECQFFQILITTVWRNQWNSSHFISDTNLKCIPDLLKKTLKHLASIHK